jgi:PKD repeat protein
VAFSAFASDPNGLPITYTWDFGDGTTGTGASVTHAYLNPGTYSAKVTVTNSVSLSETATVSVTVQAGPFPVGVMVDGDGDGFPDEVEQALGSSPTDATNTPFAMAPMPPPAKSLTISKMAITLSFSPKTPTGKDSLAVAGLLPISVGFSPVGQHVIVDVGGVVKSWVLDAKGKGTGGSKNDKFSVGFKAAKKGGVVAAQSGKYAVSLKSGTFAAKLLAYGYDNADHKAAITLQVPVAIIFNGNIYETLATQHYKSAKNKSGSSK